MSVCVHRFGIVAVLPCLCVCVCVSIVWEPTVQNQLVLGVV